MSHSPRPIDYATPAPRRRLSGPAIVLGMVLLGAVIFSVIGWWMMPRTIVTPIAFNAPAPQSPIVLTTDPMIFDLGQRSGVQLPGGLNTPILAIGDVTGGQVIVTVMRSQGPTFLSRSMKEGETVTFTESGSTYYLTLIKLTNRLTNDEAKLQISTKAPATTQKASP